MPMSSVNRVVLVGNLTRDPELRSLGNSGHSVCHLRVACNSRRKIKENEWADRTHYFDVSVFGPQAESANKFLRKGRPIAVDGRLEFREWDEAGKKRHAVSIVADTVQFLGTPDPRPRVEPGDTNGASQGLDPGTTGTSDINETSDTAARDSSDAGLERVPVPAGGPADIEDADAGDGEERSDLTF